MRRESLIRCAASPSMRHPVTGLAGAEFNVLCKVVDVAREYCVSRRVYAPRQVVFFGVAEHPRYLGNGVGDRAWHVVVRSVPPRGRRDVGR